MKKIIALFLAVLMLVTLLASCQDNQTPVETKDPNETKNEDERTLKPNLPDHVDLAKETYVIYTQPWNSYTPLAITDICPEDYTASVIAEEAYERWYEVEEELNCYIEEHIGKSSYSAGLTDLQNTLLTGEDTYSILMIRAKQYTSLISSGLLVDIKSIPYVETTQPWWNSDSYQALSINNVGYAICGDMTVNDDLNTFNIYFNKKMFENYQFEATYGMNLYDMVESGKWTFEVMYNMAKVVASHPDDTVGVPGNTANDIYGFGYIQDASVAFLNAFEVFIAQVDANTGNPKFTLSDGDNVTKMQKLLEVFSDTDTSINFHKRSENATVEETQTFLDGRELFCVGGLYYASEMRQSETDFGILPFPKYNDAQTEYSSPVVGTALTVSAVPVTNQRLEKTGILMEYFSYCGYYTLRPALYDTVLNGQLVRDAASQDMLDIIFDTIRYDTGLIFNYNLIADELFKDYNSLTNTVSSNLVGYKQGVTQAINKLILSMTKR